MKIRRRSRRKSSPKRIIRSHRTPPRPTTWDSPRGWCRLCGDPIIDGQGIQNMRRNWHKGDYPGEPDCVSIWKVSNDPTFAREYVFTRDHGRCCDCSCLVEFKRRRKIIQFGVSFEVDHIKPLYGSDGDLSFWHPDNLKIRCKPCHLIKTRTDMIEFRELKKEAQND